jgi:SM-20-related protein
MNASFDTLINSYVNKQMGIDPLFLNERLADGLRLHIIKLQQAGMLTAAGTGNKEHKAIQENIRGDKIYWLDKSNHNSFEQEFLEQADDFISYLNRSCYTGINACEFHYAVYDTNSFYKRHIDQFKNDGSRKFTLISYLNLDWIEEDGGQLHIYQDDHIEKVLPHSRTAVFFKSDELEHEVTVTHRPRMSVTGWLKRV